MVFAQGRPASEKSERFRLSARQAEHPLFSLCVVEIACRISAPNGMSLFIQLTHRRETGDCRFSLSCIVTASAHSPSECGVRKRGYLTPRTGGMEERSLFRADICET